MKQPNRRPFVPGEELLEVLDCEIGVRPAGAPGPDQLAPYLVRARQSGGRLFVSFRPEAAGTLRAFADAERLCCSHLGFEVTETTNEATLTITGTAQQIEAFGALWAGVPKSGA